MDARNTGKDILEDPESSIFHAIATEVRAMWKDEGIPTYDQKCVVKRLRMDFIAYTKTNRIPKSRRQDRSSDARFEQLFDIACCKCQSPAACSCSYEVKIPEDEWTFIQDQRGDRRLQLGAYDRATSTVREARLQRRQNRYRREYSESDAAGTEGGGTTSSGSSVAGTSGTAACAGDDSSSEADGGNQRDGSDTDGADSTCNSDGAIGAAADPTKELCDVSNAAGEDDEDFVPSPGAAAAHTSERNLDSLTNAALAAERYGVSNRAAAAVINGFQMDVGRVTENDKENIVDPKKMWRARDRIRRETACEAAESVAEAGLQSLYFDGRKDRTCAGSSVTEVEEHVVVLSEPGNNYVTHFTPSSGRALDILNELYSVSEMFGGAVKVLGCDGAAVNTGVKGGVCRLFELVTGMAVHWFVCQLHSNELNLRHLLCSLDGTTSGPRSFSGPIGSSCAADVWTLEVTSFQPVPGQVEEPPEDVVRSLSHDQQILLRLSLAVQNGTIPAATACRRIGPLNHARWLTLAARLLRLYVSTEAPSRQLAQMVQYLVHHYVPTWFGIRRNSACTEGSKNLYRSIELLRGLPEDIQSMIRPVISRNGYWAHPEQVLLAMVADDDQESRAEAIGYIQAARGRGQQEEVRSFALPAINFDAQRYVDIIDWTAEEITEPPLLRELSAAELQDIVTAPLTVPSYPVHTQAVERAVRDVTDASSRVVGEEARHGHITACLKHRSSIPVFNSKRDVLKPTGAGEPNCS